MSIYKRERIKFKKVEYSFLWLSWTGSDIKTPVGLLRKRALFEMANDAAQHDSK